MLQATRQQTFLMAQEDGSPSKDNVFSNDHQMQPKKLFYSRVPEEIFIVNYVLDTDFNKLAWKEKCTDILKKKEKKAERTT